MGEGAERWMKREADVGARVVQSWIDSYSDG